jgi:hypothetical protein
MKLKLYGNIYHGTDVDFSDVDLSLPREDRLEFGAGFYATPDFEIAKEYARAYFIDEAVSEVYIHEFEFDYEEAIKHLRYKNFEKPDPDWLDFVRANLHGENVPEYDFICGPLENDIVWDILTLLSEGKLTTEEAFDILSKVSFSTQIVIKTESAKKYLTKIGTIIIRK